MDAITLASELTIAEIQRLLQLLSHQGVSSANVRGTIAQPAKLREVARSLRGSAPKVPRIIDLDCWQTVIDAIFPNSYDINNGACRGRQQPRGYYPLYNDERERLYSGEMANVLLSLLSADELQVEILRAGLVTGAPMPVKQVAEQFGKSDGSINAIRRSARDVMYEATCTIVEQWRIEAHL